MDRNKWFRLVLIVVTVPVAFHMIGCTPDEEHRDIPPVAVKAVSAYGVTLDEKAAPQQVAYVMLRSIAEDVHAAQHHEHDKQKEAMRREQSLLAYSVIEQRLLDAENLSRKTAKSSLGPDRDEKLWDFARQLAPIIAHYVPSFDTSFDAAVSKMRLMGSLDSGTVHIWYAAAHDPGAGDPEQRDPVLIDFEMAKEKADGKEFWRVAKIVYAGRPGIIKPTTRAASDRAVSPTPATHPASVSTRTP